MKRTVWTDDMIAEGILAAVDALQINRMPTSRELTNLGRNDLHCKISRTKKYSGWAEELNLKLKSCETRLGNEFEEHVETIIKSKGFGVQRMTSKHPYDLLVNNTLKIDVKAAKPHRHFAARAHTFSLSKKFATCDLYVCIALDESGEVERYFIIPANLARLVSINVGLDSKYNRFVDQWDYIGKYVDAFESITKKEAE